MQLSSSFARRACAVRPAPARAVRSTVVVRAAAGGQPSLDRRAALLAAGAAVLAAQPQGPAFADGEVEFKQFIGYATPPTSYGGYGGNADEAPKYTFEYPANWKSEVPSKVEKGTQGVDGRVVNPRGKDLRAFVITLTRAGEDNASFRLTDLDSTFAGFAGADSALLDAVQDASDITKTEKEVDGIKVYDYDIDSPAYHYLASIAVKNGKVFALFVRCPSRLYAANQASLKRIQDTFRLL